MADNRAVRAAVEAVGEVEALWPATTVPSRHRERLSSCRTCPKDGNLFSTAKRKCRPNPCRETRLWLRKGESHYQPSPTFLFFFFGVSVCTMSFLFKDYRHAVPIRAALKQSDCWARTRYADRLVYTGS